MNGTDIRFWKSPLHDVDPTDIFTELVLSSAFEPRSAKIAKKQEIFQNFWNEDALWLRGTFDQSGREFKGEGSGFGFLVESFARFSGNLPKKNTKKGESAAKQILTELHLGERGNIPLGHRQSNSDFLWVDLTGRLITITALGEVKASAVTALNKIGGQLKRQERSVGFLVDKIRSAKSEGSLRGFFSERGINLAENIDKFLILPFGEGEKLKNNEQFVDWRIVELEFSYKEFAFIAQKLWPGFKTNLIIGPGDLSNLFELANRLGEWIKLHLDKIFVDSSEFGRSNPLPYFELGLFFLATGRIPLMEDDVYRSRALVTDCFWPAVQACLNLFVSLDLNPETDFDGRDKAIFRKFHYSSLTSDRKELENFIYFSKLLRREIENTAHARKQTDLLKGMSQVLDEIFK